MTAAFYTLGCRLNQLETEALASSFRSQGFFIATWDQPADIYILNTCTVTSKSEQKARRMIRKINRDYPQVPLIVTGCYAQMEEGALTGLGDNILIIPLDEKDIIQDLAVYLAHEVPGNYLQAARVWVKENMGLRQDSEKRFRFDPDEFSFHSRAYLKIQDGCDNQCSYCRVTLARGPSVSLDSEEVIARLNKLSQAGYQEIVLTGVNIDSYRCGDRDLPALLELILQETSGFRIRLSSLEPQSITEEFCRVVSHPRYCSYFHLSLQSGSDRILKSMQRDYTGEEVLQALSRLRQVKEDPFFAADVIAGFPGEKEEDFRLSERILKQGEFAWAHVFPYSSRPGTAAAEMKNTVNDGIIHQRAAELRTLSMEARDHYSRRYLGKELEILLEQAGEGYIQGTSGNYLNCRIEGCFPQSSRGSLVTARALSLEKNGIVYCEILNL